MTVAAASILALLCLGCAGALAPRMRVAGPLIHGATCLLCLCLLGSGFAALPGQVSQLALPVGLAGGGSHLRLDALSGFFLMLIGLGGTAASLFAIGYGRHERDPGRILPFFPPFLGAMALVVIADDAFSFLFGWELMSLTSWALMMAHHRQPGNAQAGFVYLLMASLSGLALLLAFGLLSAVGGGYGFDAMRQVHPGGAAAAVVLVLALIGAGGKAGLVPLHVWLPLAHPAAPSHVSAVMSGVMTKVAAYGFIRIAFDVLGAPDWWAGCVVLLAGSATAAAGVLYALMERDLKRLLACSTIENVGIVFIGLGLALAFRSNGLQAGAALALTASLFHALNHTLFKSLLFFGAGAVQHAAGTRDLEGMGGLIHRMPRTAAAMLAGSAAIAGLPPLNGFASEWLTFQAILLRPELPQWGLKLAIPLAGALLALTAALAAGCFVRAFGIGFLGRARSDGAAEAHETDAWRLAAMLILTALCLLAGILPGVVIDAISPVAQALAGARMPVQLGDAWLTVTPVAAGRSSYNGLLILAFIAASGGLTLAVVRRLSGPERRAPAWDCGFPLASPAVAQYSAAGFAQPMRRVFGATLFRARDLVDMPDPGDSRPAVLTSRMTDPAWDGAYRPLGRAVAWAAGKANAVQYLTIRRYLGFVFATLVILLLALTLWQ